MTNTAVTQLPKDAAMWACFGVSSWTTKHSGAFRLYVMARTLDQQGSGHIAADTLKEAAMQLNVKPRTYAYWLADAIGSGLFERLHGGILRIHSQQTAARIFGVKQVDKTKVIISLKALFKNGWRARIWAAYIKANHNGKPISQKKLEDITGIPVRTQKSLGRYIHSRRQIGITNRPAEAVTGMNEFTSQGKAFAFTDPQQNNERVAAIHLPSIKSVDNKIAKITNAGRRSAILAHLAVTSSWLVTTGNYLAQADNYTVNRLFYSTPKQIKKATRLTQTMSRLPQDPDRIFVKRRQRWSAWDVYFLPSQDAYFLA